MKLRVWSDESASIHARHLDRTAAVADLADPADHGLTSSMDTELANDRTYLAWLRTGIALFGLGFVVAKVALIIEPETSGVSDARLYTGGGVLIVLSGAALVLVGYLQHRAIGRELRADRDDLRPPLWPLTITAIALTASVVLSALLIVST